MNLVEIRQEIVEKLDELDGAMLRAIHTIVFNVPAKNGSPTETEEAREQYTNLDGTVDPDRLGDSDVYGYEPDGTPITIMDVKKIVGKGQEEIDKGNYTTLDELKKESEQWLQDMK